MDFLCIIAAINRKDVDRTWAGS